MPIKTLTVDAEEYAKLIGQSEGLKVAVRNATAAPKASPDSIPMRASLWARIKRIVDDAEGIRSSPHAWPLTQPELAAEVRRLHYVLKEVSESHEYVALKMWEAAQQR